MLSWCDDRLPAICFACIHCKWFLNIGYKALSGLAPPQFADFLHVNSGAEALRSSSQLLLDVVCSNCPWSMEWFTTSNKTRPHYWMFTIIDEDPFLLCSFLFQIRMPLHQHDLSISIWICLLLLLFLLCLASIHVKCDIWVKLTWHQEVG